MSSGIETGLVTVLYNAIEVLPDFFKSLNSQTYTRFRLYIIDNSPGPEVLEESINLAEKYQIDFRYVRNEVNNRSEEHTSELQSRGHLVCRLLLEKKNNFTRIYILPTSNRH